ncbi:sulfotransferase [Chromohalobacter sp. 48-RD10]|uniref:O-linked N-acetylglucosamine transferase family protein n=1 Tax=Chromohalobacter sp. 48-RD10 TaxID=2994063 RepID=UPI0024689908|nr:sulfotransferase [Chromohalobacter sp. 48-RD10]
MSKKRNRRHASTNDTLTLAQARKQTQRAPSDPDAWLALGRLLVEQKDWQKAREALEQSQSLRPDNVDQKAWLGHVAYHQNRPQDAFTYLHNALSQNPTLTLGLVTLARLHIDRSEFQQGLEYAQKAYAASPQHIPAIDTLASALSGLYRYEEAFDLYRHLTKLVPKDFSSWNNAGNMLRDLGRLNESYTYYEQASKVGHHPAPYSNHLTALHYDPRVSREELMAFAKSWEERFAPASHLVPPRPEHPNAAAEQKLRLGLLSDGFRKHPVGKMITRCLEQLSKGQFELYCYTTSDAVDAVTKRIQRCAQHWQPIRHLGDEEFAQQIRDDEIDILIDLSGHNTGSRMRAVAMQPAPLIVKWVGGLINTTGVQAIDYLISDHVETPEGEDEYYTEKLIRMPDDYIVFNPPEKLPALSAPPAQHNGYITLACFNNPTKLNDVALKQWASIMHELPNSRLLLKGRPYTSESFCERLYATLEAEGIDRERLVIEGPGNNHEMLEAYNRADIALDPWPYSGGLTTCESFIMGVPVVTLPGPTFAGRHSATHLVHAGMPELVVNSWEEYRARVIELASDLESLGTIRQHLRDILLQSPVCDGPRFARHFTNAMRAIWKRYCDDKTPAALTFNKDGEARFEDEDTPVEIHYAEASEEDAEFQWQFEGKLIAVDNGGQLLTNEVIRQLLQRDALELIAFDPSSQALDTSLKQHKGVHYYPSATLGDGQPGQLHACLDPKLSASLAPLGDEYQPEAIRTGSQVLTRLPLNTIKLDSIDGLPAIDWLVLDDLNDAIAILDNGTQALKDTLLLQVKVAFQPTHERQPNLAELQHWASRNGFRFYRLHEPQHRSHLPEDVPEAQRQATELASADALLLPSHERMEALSDNQRTRLAFLLHTAFGVKDVVYSLLTDIDVSLSQSYLKEERLTSYIESSSSSLLPSEKDTSVKRKVFVVGFPKSGTSTIQKALQSSGYNSAHWQVKEGFVGELMYRGLEEHDDPWHYLGQYDAITQGDVCIPSKGLNFWPQLDPTIIEKIQEKHPNCLFILNYRNPEKTVSSIKRWGDMSQRFLHSNIPGLPAGKGNDQQLLDWIHNHFTTIRKNLSQNKNFLEVDIENDETPNMIAKELNISIDWWGVANKNTAQYSQAISVDFICGCGHSGTTLLLNILRQHRDIYTPNTETYMMFPDNNTNSIASNLIKEAKKEGCSRIIEKTPRHLYFMDDIRKKFPNAKFLIPVRDGRDVATSIKRRIGSLKTGAERWIRDNSIVLKEIEKADCYWYRHEDLVKNPEETLKGICSFLGIQFSEELLNFHENKFHWNNILPQTESSGKEGIEHKKLRSYQVNQPIFDNTGNWKKELSPEDRKYIKEKLESYEGNRIMTFFGYNESDDKKTTPTNR